MIEDYIDLITYLREYEERGKEIFANFNYFKGINTIIETFIWLSFLKDAGCNINFYKVLKSAFNEQLKELTNINSFDTSPSIDKQQLLDKLLDILASCKDNNLKEKIKDLMKFLKDCGLLK